MAARRPAAPRPQDYRANRYHGVNDEYDPTWDWTGALADVGIYYRVGRDAGDDARLAELAPRRRIPRHPRSLARGAMGLAGASPGNAQQVRISGKALITRPQPRARPQTA